MVKIKSIIATILCGFTSISLFPSTDYNDGISHSANEISRKAWKMTSKSLTNSITKVGSQIESAKESR